MGFNMDNDNNNITSHTELTVVLHTQMCLTQLQYKSPQRANFLKPLIFFFTK